jgi:hypothetical protein
LSHNPMDIMVQREICHAQIRIGMGQMSQRLVTATRHSMVHGQVFRIFLTDPLHPLGSSVVWFLGTGTMPVFSKNISRWTIISIGLWDKIAAKWEDRQKVGIQPYEYIYRILRLNVKQPLINDYIVLYCVHLIFKMRMKDTHNINIM